MSWGRFLPKEHDDERVAFEALSTLDAVCENETLLKVRHTELFSQLA